MRYFSNNCDFEDITFWVSGLLFLVGLNLWLTACFITLGFFLFILNSDCFGVLLSLLGILTKFFFVISVLVCFFQILKLLFGLFLVLHFAGYMDCCCLYFLLDFLFFSAWLQSWSILFNYIQNEHSSAVSLSFLILSLTDLWTNLSLGKHDLSEQAEYLSNQCSPILNLHKWIFFFWMSLFNILLHWTS